MSTAISSGGVYEIPLSPSSSSSGYYLSVSVQGVQFSYSFTEEDVRKVFSRYGRLQAVELVGHDAQSVRVLFANHYDAEEAMKDLNDKVLSGIHGRLSVHWTSGKSPVEQPMTDEGSLDHLNTSHFSSPEFGLMHPSGEQSVRKFTCRFEIGIENDKEFQVARRLIGMKGSNMKRINKETEAKLRLRGRGSGYLEGAAKVESPEPLHLCISCVNQTGYRQAVALVSELLLNIYEEYRRFCKAKNIPFPAELSTLAIKEYPLITYGFDQFDQPDTPPPKRDDE